MKKGFLLTGQVREKSAKSRRGRSVNGFDFRSVAWLPYPRQPGPPYPPAKHLIKFLKEHGMPLGELEEEGLHKILIIGAEKLFSDRVQELLPH